MSNRKVKYSVLSSEDEERINYLMPDIVLAVEALHVATADKIHMCLEECDIKATPSQIISALEYGCRLGLMEERTRYRLNPELNNPCTDCCESILPTCCEAKSKLNQRVCK